MARVNYYDVLSISVDATAAEIRRAYRKASLPYHPDKVAKPTQETNDKFLLVQKAFEVLTNEPERAAYDRKFDAMHDTLKGFAVDNAQVHIACGNAMAYAFDFLIRHTSTASEEEKERVIKEHREIIDRMKESSVSTIRKYGGEGENAETSRPDEGNEWSPEVNSHVAGPQGEGSGCETLDRGFLKYRGRKRVL